MTLNEFLLARIAEDEAVAERAGSFTPWDVTFQNDNYGHLTIQPARVLAECEAKRRIVEEHPWGEWDICTSNDAMGHLEPAASCPVLRHLAAVYADHPDYDESWRP